MKVKRAAVLGRCMGVRRAEDLARRAAQEGGPVYTLGPLIHNPQAVRELAEKGIVAIEETELDDRTGRGESFAGKTVVIRAHGVPPALRDRLSAMGARIVDATCPRVIASQRRARDYADRGYLVVIAGDAGHGEVTGIAGYAPGSIVVGGPEEASRIESINLDGSARPVALIAQTTIKREEYEAIREVLAARHPGLEVVDSICPCTGERLAALAELAAEVDAVVVVGGRNSANTARLLKSALELGVPSWLVETAAELPPEVFGYERVGLTAGASTPERFIDDVEKALLGQGPHSDIVEIEYRGDSMDLLPELVARRAYRTIAADQLPEDQINRLLEAATLAPSCYNNQPWRLIAVTGEALPAIRETLTENNKWATRAPLIVVFATKPALDCRLDSGRDYALFDLGQAAMAFQLQATREGLYSHPIAGYAPAKVAKAIGLPEDFIPVTLMIVGKPGDSSLLSEWQVERDKGARQRKAMSEVVYRDHWSGPKA
jgi:4-hydroxy-3-methylbut-2-enyl diphosphate reductase